MKSENILKNVGISPDEPLIFMTAEEAIQNLMEMLEEIQIDLKMDKMSKEDIEALLSSYIYCIGLYHPENYHQERAVFLRNFEMLKKYGLEDDDYLAIDFC